MSADPQEDSSFYDRADAHIRLANEQYPKIGRGKVSASFLYGASRFQAWNAACWASDRDDMKAKREETIKYFVEQYQAMLEENLDDYIENYDDYMRSSGG